jgi:hypothetical protein
MFPLADVRAAQDIIGTEPWAFIGCVSFEARWNAFVDAADNSNFRPSISTVMFPIDSGSRWQKECADRQEKNWQSSPANGKWKSVRCDVQLLGPSPWYRALRALTETLDRAVATKVRTLIIDFTTMPRVLYLPIILKALRDTGIETLIAVYTQPLDYTKGPLTTEPVDAIVVPTFSELPIKGKERARIGWIPILGFGPCFATKITEYLAEYNMAGRVYPLIGYPGYNPTFFERVLNDSARTLLELLERPTTEEHFSLRDHFIYASASDPYETREAVLRLTNSAPGTHWVGTPMGPKPMALGLILAAAEASITMVIARPRSYHPDYSSGAERTLVYPLRIHGKSAF